MNRERILAVLEAAAGAVERADGALAVAEAYEWVTRRPGLWYAPVSAAGGRVMFVVGCNGAVIGTMRPAGSPLSGWSAATLAGVVVYTGRGGVSLRTARACAAALARRVGAKPGHVD